jgi:transposase-like protein
MAHMTPKQKTRRLTSAAIRAGRLVRPSACEECGRQRLEVGVIQAAHYNYSPGNHLIVRWLCPQCHSQWDLDVPKPVEIRDDEQNRDD